MTHQTHLFDLHREPLAASRRTDPASSRAAAERMNASGEAQTQSERVRWLIYQHPGSTAYELADYSNHDGGKALTQVQICRRLPMPGIVAPKSEHRECLITGTVQQTWWDERMNPAINTGE